MLLIVGSKEDHNIARLVDAAEWRKHPHRVIYTDADPRPDVSWQPGSPDITINGETFSAAGASLFIRYDVFSEKDPASKAAFFDTFRGWAEAYPSVGLLNRANETMEMSKPRALVLAQGAGFSIPATVITNDFNAFADRDAWIAKPVSGGEYTKVLKDMPETTERPWIVQEKLQYPELRLFRVGNNYLAFEITSAVIDYRTTDAFTMREVEPPKALVESMKKLTDHMGLDYAAADLKTNPRTGTLDFMEINTMPMFTGYDDTAKGRLSDAILLTLKKLAQPAQSPRVPQPKPGI